MTRETYLVDGDEDSFISEDSGLVEDAFDVLPDEKTLAFDIDLDLDLSEENFGRCSTSDDFSDLLELDTSLTDLDENIFTNVTTLPVVQNKSIYSLKPQLQNKDDKDTQHSNKKSNNLQDPASNSSDSTTGKLVSFSKDQARQWRRKRILKSNEKNIQRKPCPAKLEPLLPLPKTLKPLSIKGTAIRRDITSKTKNEKIDPKEKLANPLLGGEKLGTKTKRGPVPMKLRALPESFWKEPKSIQTSSMAGNNFAVLPPLFSSEGKSAYNMTTIRPVTPPDDKKNSPRHSPRSKKKLVMTNPPNTELLFSLFDHLEDKVDERLIVRRGRPKKSTSDRVPPPPTRRREEDPCIVDALATTLFPELSLHKSPTGKDKLSSSCYAMIRIGKGNRTVEFPAIQAKENYPAILNELVTHM